MIGYTCTYCDESGTLYDKLTGEITCEDHKQNSTVVVLNELSYYRWGPSLLEQNYHR